ncbi:MAG: hypothetical protein KFF77_00185 [Bacteroidetes bacterium]|nr:hypothetical protein [Bacteroidota bacterium]
MNRETLIEEAGQLAPVSPQILEEFTGRRELLAASFNQRFSTRPDLEQLVGAGNMLMMENNHRNHLRFMESMFTRWNPEVYVDTILWVYRAYRAHGFRLAYWPAQLDAWIELFRKELSPEAFAEIEPYYRWILVRQAAFAAISDEALREPPRGFRNMDASLSSDKEVGE